MKDSSNYLIICGIAIVFCSCLLLVLPARPSSGVVVVAHDVANDPPPKYQPAPYAKNK